MRSTSCLEIARPRPVPPYFLVVEPSTWLNFSNTESILSAGMPGPVSRTEIRIRARAASRDSHSTAITMLPLGVNLMALPTRLVITWRIRPASPTKCRGTSAGYCKYEVEFPVLDLRRQHLVHFFDRQAQVERVGLDRQLAGLDPGKVEDIVDDREQTLPRTAHGLGILPLLGGQFRIQQQAGHADHAIHRRADLMAHVGQEFGLVTAGGFRLQLGVMQLDDQAAAARILRYGDPGENEDRARSRCHQRQETEVPVPGQRRNEPNRLRTERSCANQNAQNGRKNPDLNACPHCDDPVCTVLHRSNLRAAAVSARTYRQIADFPLGPNPRVEPWLEPSS